MTINPGTSYYYADTDGDGFGNLASPSLLLCAAPRGYVANSTDCDDTNAEVNPGHVEIAGDTIDNNCDGRIDEVGPSTNLIKTICGRTLSSLSSPIYVTKVPVAIGYRYEVSYGTTPTVSVYETTANNITLYNVVSPVYSTAYSIRVSVKTSQANGQFWQAYGTSCTVTTPAPPKTQLVSSVCGKVITSFYAPLYANAVALATGYRFKVNDGVSERTLDSATNLFNLMQLAGGATVYGTYTISVAVQYNGAWETTPTYGNPCTVTIQAPTSQLVSSVCGTNLTSVSAPLYANAVALATSYRFNVLTTSDVPVGTYESASNVFNLMQITGGAVTYATTYKVRVDVQTTVAGTYNTGTTLCTVTTPAMAPTQLVASVCGTNLTSIYAPLYANAVALATSYKFNVFTNATPGVLVGTYQSSSNVFNLMQITGGTVGYDTTYKVSVDMQNAGSSSWVQGTTLCNVKTPVMQTTKLVNNVCGARLTSLNTPLYCNAISLVTAYKFNVLTTSDVPVGTYESTSNVFNLMQITGGAVGYDTTYKVRVDIQNGVGTPFIQGLSSCNVTTPVIPKTTVVASRCNTTLTSLYAPIYANAITLATGYAFKVVENVAGFPLVGTYSSANNVFTLKQVSGTTKGKSYLVSVAIQISGGVYQDYGTACPIATAANAATRMDEENVNATIFTAKAFPNPFETSFNLAIESSSDDQVEVKVYDMIGRELEARKATVSELSTQEIGNNYPQGVYNIIVSQGDQVKTLRMIKR